MQYVTDPLGGSANNPNHSTVFTYDFANHLNQVAAPAGTTTTYQSVQSAELVNLANGGGAINPASLIPVSGVCGTSTDPLQATARAQTTYTFDRFGDPTYVYDTAVQGDVTTCAYNSNGLLTMLTLPDSGTGSGDDGSVATQYSYDGNGNLIQRNLARRRERDLDLHNDQHLRRAARRAYGVCQPARPPDVLQLRHDALSE